MSTPSENHAASDEVQHHAQADVRTGIPTAKVTLTDPADQRTKNVLAPPPGVIPVIFIPGIMGTNLKALEDGKAVWRPPNMDGLEPVLDAIGQLFTYLFKKAGTRQRELTPSAVTMDDRGPIDPGESGLSEAVCRQRGWGSVMRSSYQPVMAWLQKHLNDTMEMGKLHDLWQDEAQTSPADWGDTQGNAGLSLGDIKHMANYHFDVWGCGYNWLQSNKDSGQAVADFIRTQVLPSYKGAAQKVVVVTHSMGGLVARALTQIHHCSDVLGVVHGVQPATGAPASYKRMRAGFEGVEQVILGRNAAEVTAVLAHSPGGLELLPTADYNGGKAWLKVRGVNTPANTPDAMLPLALPQTGDPYAEIYLSDQWYGLLPKQSEGMLDMQKHGANEGGQQSPEELRQKFEDRMDGVRKFHKKIQASYFHPTYAHYGADKARKCWGEVVWVMDGAVPPDARLLQMQSDDQNGEVSFTNGLSASIAPPDVPGDGTVPMPSGSAPGLAAVEGSFVHGRQQPEGKEAARNKDKKGYDHQSSYNDPRARFATLYGIAKAAQKATWHE